MNANKAHETLAHASPDTCKITSKELGWKLIGEFKKCVHCSLAKIKTETLNKKVKFEKRKEVENGIVKKESNIEKKIYILE